MTNYRVTETKTSLVLGEVSLVNSNVEEIRASLVDARLLKSEIGEDDLSVLFVGKSIFVGFRNSGLTFYVLTPR